MKKNMKKKETKRPQDFPRPLNKFGSKIGPTASWWYENSEENLPEEDETILKLTRQIAREKAGY
jgi:hypothetical protein